MATNILTVYFLPCTPTPVNGYKVSYRPVGSILSYRNGGLFTTPPAVVNDVTDPEGTQYEGFIQSDCGNGILGTPIPFLTVAPAPTDPEDPEYIECNFYRFTPMGTDDSNYTVQATLCDGTALNINEYVGGASASQHCIRVGTLIYTGSVIVEDLGPCANGASFPVFFANDMTSICAAVEVNYIYVSGEAPSGLVSGMTIYYDEQLIAPVTDRQFFRDTNARIFQVNSSGVITNTNTSC